MKRYVVYHQEWQDDAEIETVCDTRADAEELILALTEEDVYYQAMYEGVNNFFNNSFEFRKSRHPEMKCKTHYGTALWFMSGRFIIDELGEY